MNYYMSWREDFDEYDGWFTELELRRELERMASVVGGEFSIRTIIQGEEVSHLFMKKPT